MVDDPTKMVDRLGKDVYLVMLYEFAFEKNMGKKHTFVNKQRVHQIWKRENLYGVSIMFLSADKSNDCVKMFCF